VIRPFVNGSRGLIEQEDSAVDDRRRCRKDRARGSRARSAGARRNERTSPVDGRESIQRVMWSERARIRPPAGQERNRLDGSTPCRNSAALPIEPTTMARRPHAEIGEEIKRFRPGDAEAGRRTETADQDRWSPGRARHNALGNIASRAYRTGSDHDPHPPWAIRSDLRESGA